MGHTFFILGGMLLSASLSVQQSSKFLSKWKCNSEEECCKKVSDDATDAFPSLETCRLVCGKYGGLWPQPAIYCDLADTLFTFPLSSITVNISAPEDNLKQYLDTAFNIFKQSISQVDTQGCKDVDHKVGVSVSVTSTDTTLNWSTEEGYTIEVATEDNLSNVQIVAVTIFGARHALETLSQLIDIYETNEKLCHVIVSQVKISDRPAFPHRGLMLDTARHFLTVESIKTQIDGMGYSKLNVLHWHITDSQSFPLEAPSLPNMTRYGAYSTAEIYHTADLADIISYARSRGIRVIIEIDAPSHAGNGWQWGPEAGLGDLSLCVNQQPWRSYCIEPPCGQLNPLNGHVYDVLKSLYKDIMSLLPKGEVFHMGGDEVFIGCWNSTPAIVDYLGNKSLTERGFLDLWAQFQAKALGVFDSVVGNSDTPIVMWTSDLTDVSYVTNYLPTDRYVIQPWVPASESLPVQLLKLGYQVIISTKDAWYLDHGFWGHTAYHNWRVVYNNVVASGALGGEVCMWTEYVDTSAVTSRIWPRAAAAAERLWANPGKASVPTTNRFSRHRERLVSRGVQADVIAARWCYENEGEC